MTDIQKMVLNESNLKKVQKIAQSVRRWAKSLQRKHPKLGDQNLACMCGISSFELFRRLKSKGFKAYLFSNKDHCFVEWKNFIIDVTATQFCDYPAVTIVHRKPGLEVFWNRGRQRKLERVADAKKWFRGWPPPQCPFRYLKNV